MANTTPTTPTTPTTHTKLPRIPVAGFGDCPQHGYFSLQSHNGKCFVCEREKDRTTKGFCNAVLCHGPGHQSKTYCAVIGEHKIHRCIYGSFSQEANWIDPENKHKCTGFFDEPPCDGE